ncbi:hypothetical protein [Pseudomonas syringae]|uniref:hypothetical protein n=1 Tax=Pseudomonas syringae TaxID=317 RepID=UPI0018A137E1|nr:hypothetical protein [Pseudomonas syringae]
MSVRRLAIPEIETYRYAVFCCSFKVDLSSTPDHALALFVDVANTFEVVDVVTGQPICA